MSIRYIDANALIDKVDEKTQNIINEMPCIFADYEPGNSFVEIKKVTEVEMNIHYNHNTILDRLYYEMRRQLIKYE